MDTCIHLTPSHSAHSSQLANTKKYAIPHATAIPLRYTLVAQGVRMFEPKDKSSNNSYNYSTHHHDLFPV